MTQNIPVLLLTGYLGAGKTTLLNKILSNRRGIKFAVIVNDIGEVNIDADLIQKGGIVGKKDDSLVALQNGCICCTLKMDLVEQLREITAMHKFDYIVIEASGVCEPAPIAQTICSIPTMGEQYTKDGIAQLDCIVTVVDALRMKDEFANGNNLLAGNLEEDDIENLVIQQIEFCNIVLLNKASEVSKDDLGCVEKIIKSLQPHAQIIECDYGDVDLDKLLNTHMFDFDKVAASAAWIEEVEGHHDHDDDEEDGFDEDEGDEYDDEDGHEHHHDEDDEDHEGHRHHHDDEDHEGHDDDHEDHKHHHHDDEDEGHGHHHHDDDDEDDEDHEHHHDDDEEDHEHHHDDDEDEDHGHHHHHDEDDDEHDEDHEGHGHHHDDDDEDEGHGHHHDDEDESHGHHHHHDEDDEDHEGHEHHHDDDDEDHEGHGHHHHHHHHDHEGGEVEEYGIGTYVYWRRKPFDINKFDNFVAKHWPKSVIRAKGICYFSDEFDACYIFEQAGRQVSLRNAGQWFATMPQENLRQMMEQDPNLVRDWDPTYGDRMQKLVFIGQHLDKAAIAKFLDECLVD